MITREQIEAALWALLAGAAGFKGTSRRFVHWDEVNGNGTLPFLTLLKGNELREHRGNNLPLLTLTYHVFVYTSAGLDQNNTPATPMNALLDAVDASLAPTSGSDFAENRQTLGGLVEQCFPQGEVFVDTGDIDGKGVAAVPVHILVPWSAI